MTILWKKVFAATDSKLSWPSNLIAKSEPPESKDSGHDGKSPLAHDALCLTMHISVVFNAAANVT